MAKAQKTAAPDAPAPVSKYRQVIDILNDTQEKVNKLLTGDGDEMHRLRIDKLLTSASQHLGLLTATSGTEEAPLAKLGPATTAGGVPIGVKAPVQKADVEPKAEALQVLTGKVESLYSQFLSIDSKEILLKYEDLVIRGVAKKAHLKVTKDDPETLTLEFIDQIKEAILENDELESKKQPADKEVVDLSEMGAEDNDPEF